MTKWGLLAFAIASEVTATLCLKAALDQPLLYLIVAAGFISAFAFLTSVLRRGMALGVAYGIWAASGVWLTAAFSALFYGEPFTLTMVGGLVLIVGGVLLVELGSEAAHPTNTATRARTAGTREGGV